MASGCTRKSLKWILANTCSLEGLSKHWSKWLSHHSQTYLKNAQTWHLGTLTTWQFCQQLSLILAVFSSLNDSIILQRGLRLPLQYQALHTLKSKTPKLKKHFEKGILFSRKCSTSYELNRHHRQFPTAQTRSKNGTLLQKTDVQVLNTAGLMVCLP